MGADEAVWSYVAYLWTQWGKPPFLWVWDTKPPAIYELFALARLAHLPAWAGVRALGLAATLGSAYLVFSLGRELFGERAGLLGALIFGLSSGWRLVDGPYLGETEVFGVFFSLLAGALALKRRWSFLAGLAGGLAVNFKPVFAASLLGLAILTRPPKRWLWWASAGAALGFALPFVPVVLGGEGLGHYFQTALSVLAHYAPDPKRRLSGFLNSWFRSPFLVFWLTTLLFALRERENRWRLLAWLALDFLGVNASGFYWGHQLRQALPAASLAAGAALAGAELPLWVGLVWGLAAETGFRRPGEDREVARFVRGLTSPEETVLFLGKEGITVVGYLERRLASPVFNSGLLVVPGALERLKEDAAREEPRVVILSEDAVGKPWARGLLKGYRLLKSFNKYQVYALSLRRSPSTERLRLRFSETRLTP